MEKSPMPLQVRATQFTGDHAESRADENPAQICLVKARLLC